MARAASPRDGGGGGCCARNKKTLLDLPGDRRGPLGSAAISRAGSSARAAWRRVVPRGPSPSTRRRWPSTTAGPSVGRVDRDGDRDRRPRSRRVHRRDRAARRRRRPGTRAGSSACASSPRARISGVAAERPGRIRGRRRSPRRGRGVRPLCARPPRRRDGPRASVSRPRRGWGATRSGRLGSPSTPRGVETRGGGGFERDASDARPGVGASAPAKCARRAEARADRGRGAPPRKQKKKRFDSRHHEPPTHQ